MTNARFRACLLAVWLLIAAAPAAAEDQPRREHGQDGASQCPGDCGGEHASVIERESGKSFHRHDSRYFVIYFERDARWARERGELLDVAHDRFYTAFEDAGFLPAPLRDRLTCVIFDDPQDFASYARRIDRVDMSWSRGYYSARTNRMALFDERRSEPVAFPPAMPTGALMEAAGERTLGDAAPLVMRSPPDGDPNWGDAGGMVARMVAVNTAKTAHEAAHQLAFNSGLQKRGVMYPLWVSEGLATNFEPSDVSEAFGPAFDNPSRRRQLSAAMGRRLVPLHEFVSLVRLPTGDRQAVVDLYAQAWGLFHFLFNERPTELRLYMAALAELRPGARDAAAMRREFEAAFGPVEDVAADWEWFLAAVE